MGMSASQARFLSLTARKNNVEFEGQQINQQRTTLSNESASYYSELCNMAVPTPPSIDDYTKVSYTFNDGAMTNTLTSLLPDTTTEGRANNRYVVNYVEEWQDDYAIVPAASSLVEKNGDTYSIGSSKLRKTGEDPNGANVIPENYIEDNGEKYEVFYDDGQPYYNKPKAEALLSDYEEGMIKYYVLSGSTPVLKYFVGKSGQIYAVDDIKEENPVTIVEDDYVIATEDKNGTTFLVEVVDGKHRKLDENEEHIPDERIDIDDPSKIKSNGTGKISNSTSEKTGDEYWDSLNEDQRTALLQNEEYLLKMVQEKTGDDGDFYIRYIKNTTTGNYEPYLYAYSELSQGAKYNNKNLGSIPCYSLGSTTQTREILHKNATVEKDSSGRYVAITIELEPASDGKEAVTRTYNLTTTTTTDEEAYNDAMNQYNYAQHEYDHKIQEINSKLEIVQQQDKQLELKLKQLDTEENAISTEMDAVKKVISKNVESSFKTFNA